MRNLNNLIYKIFLELIGIQELRPLLCIILQDFLSCPVSNYIYGTEVFGFGLFPNNLPNDFYISIYPTGIHILLITLF